MSGLFRALRKALGFSKAPKRAILPIRDLAKFAEGERVLVDGLKLSAPLQKNGSSNYKNGLLPHNDIIGKPLSSFYIRGPKGIYKIDAPTLDDYVSLTPRLVTPVYANYASSIVSLLDIHPIPWTDEKSPVSSPLEILEAGTGHGSLTLHISRAIAAANPPPLNIPVPQYQKNESQQPEPALETGVRQAWSEWKQSRRAILHTVEKVEANRWHAEKIVRGYRQGLYWPHVDFYAGDASTWIQAQSTQRKLSTWNPFASTSEDGFLDYVLLDMPGVHTQLQYVSGAMRDGAKVVVFTPSVTQIGECAKAIQDSNLPLVMERVLELGEGISTGRRWDVRMVMPRKHKDRSKPSTTEPVAGVEMYKEPPQIDSNEDDDSIVEKAALEALGDRLPEEQPDEPVMICRPLVGERTMGGGFIALFKKISPESAAIAAEWRRGQTGWAKKRNR
ncbi:uncharacterized protein PV06_00181 [Exophiala oligosperma]|uniref:tRNA (adenine(58)-N(1))-methyltransferase catalytic subunit TRM61 n=1 Tax=Exophiala oligosperma TaxID=215243 RepID=A0A0D2CC27_9EURO|nr:uncharacterized protein PV06_00181 [Exophiala oligosperma]KIW47487.1 hypothetical protein PV06_00181 [Exophiala oligosperma]